MNRDDVLSAAMDVGAIASPAWVRRAGESGDVFSFTTDELERFAAIIEQRARESEREACAIEALRKVKHCAEVVCAKAGASGLIYARDYAIIELLDALYEADEK